MKKKKMFKELRLLYVDNVRMFSALTVLKGKMAKDRADKSSGRKVMLDEDDLNEVLAIAGMLDDDCEDDPFA